MQHDLTKGNITKTIILFALPMIVGNLLQQFYNVADTLIVGKYLGSNALAAVGSSFTLMTFLTSILLGLCMGAGALFSILWGKKEEQKLRAAILHAFILIAVLMIILNILVYVGIDELLVFLQVPSEVYTLMREYLWYIFMGIGATFLYNFFACYLRSIGNSTIPLYFLAISALLNIGLDLFFVLYLKAGVAGAAIATVMAQYVSGIGITLYTIKKFPTILPNKEEWKWDWGIVKEIGNLSLLTCLQQSVMNFGILMVQGLVNSFGATIMAAFAAAVKIDSFAYMPVQDFGNAFSSFVAQNYGAKEQERIEMGIKKAIQLTFLFCVIVSSLVVVFANELMLLFVKAEEVEILSAGVLYLRVVAPFYFGIGILFLLYGIYRAMKRPSMSVVLTIISLGTRVLLAYVLSAYVGEIGIWISIPIGWILADLVGGLYYFVRKRDIFLSI